MIFPGMDPYLEDPIIWPGVHATFIVYLSDALQPAIGSRYVAAVEERVYVEGAGRDSVPDISIKPTGGSFPESTAVLEADAPVSIETELEIHESYLTLLDLEADQKIVTVLELLSPANKYAGPGWR